jgi:predicted dehydrogenase
MATKAAILGAGNMGRRHAASLIKLGVPITAICDINQEVVKNFIADMGIRNAVAYRDFENMLAKEDFNTLFICLPPFAQDKQFEKAAGQGKHIFIEKPIALCSSAGADMVRSAQKGRITTMVGFHMRQGAVIKRLGEIIQTGEAGRPVLFNAQYQCNDLHAPWWINADLSGGQIIEQAIHLYDLCRYFFGDPKFVEGIMANVCHNKIPGYTVEDVSACIAGWTTGAMASITANNCSIPGKWTGKVTVIFEKITAEFSDHNHGTITWTMNKEIKTEIINSDIDPYLGEITEFLECVERGKQTRCSILEGFKSLCFVEAVVQSAKLDGIKFIPMTRC